MGRTMSTADEAMYRKDAQDALDAHYPIKSELFAELDAERAAHEETRKRIAELERERDGAKRVALVYAERLEGDDPNSVDDDEYHLAGYGEIWRNRAKNYEIALAASQAECARLREALVKWNGHLSTCTAMEVSASSGKRMSTPCSCGWRVADELALAARQPDAALREVCEKVAWATKARCEDYHARYKMQGLPFNSADAEHIVSSVLGPPAQEDSHE